MNLTPRSSQLRLTFGHPHSASSLQTGSPLAVVSIVYFKFHSLPISFYRRILPKVAIVCLARLLLILQGPGSIISLETGIVRGFLQSPPENGWMIP